MTTRVLVIDRLGTDTQGARVTFRFKNNLAFGSMTLRGHIAADTPTGYRQSLPRGAVLDSIECDGPISFSIQDL